MTYLILARRQCVCSSRGGHRRQCFGRDRKRERFCYRPIVDAAVLLRRNPNVPYFRPMVRYWAVWSRLEIVGKRDIPYIAYRCCTLLRRSRYLKRRSFPSGRVWEELRLSRLKDDHANSRISTATFREHTPTEYTTDFNW